MLDLTGASVWSRLVYGDVQGDREAPRSEACSGGRMKPPEKVRADRCSDEPRRPQPVKASVPAPCPGRSPGCGQDRSSRARWGRR